MKFKDYDNYDEYDEYGVGGYQKIKRKKSKDVKKSGKGHQTRHKEGEIWGAMELQYWDNDGFDITEELLESRSSEIAPQNIQREAPDTNYKSERPSTNSAISFQAGPNTHTIKGNVIDFDRILGMEKVENEHGGKLTYGIKFLFVGKKGLSRIAWFNKNLSERDSIYDVEYAFWQSLHNNV